MRPVATSARKPGTPNTRANSKKGLRRKAGAESSESVPDLHPPACSDVAHDGRSGPRWYCRVPAVAGLGAAAGGLPDDPGADVLSGRRSGSDDVGRYRAARKTIRASAGSDADDVDQL